jgi:niacin transporter
MTNTNISKRIVTMCIAALLCAVGIIIPMFSPIRFVMEPASYTLASHVAIFIAMFISPPVAAAVALVTGFGFFIAGFPLVIVLRALTHIIFATLGAFLLKKNNNILLSMKSMATFAFFISLVHAVAEVMVVSFYYWGGMTGTAYYEQGYLITVIGLVGVGTVIHSLIDFSIAVVVWKPLQHVLSIPANAKIRAR